MINMLSIFPQFAIILLIPLLLWTATSIQQNDNQASRNNQAISGPKYTVVALKRLRPNDIYPLSITLNNIDLPVEFTASITGGRDSNREQSKEVSFFVQPNKTEHVQIRVDDWPSLEYTLTIVGRSQDGTLDINQEIPLQYESKSFLIFIQTDKAIYKPGERIQFRALMVTSSLKPKSINSNITIEIFDSRRNLIKQWKKLSTRHGVVSEQFQLSQQPNLGDWTIEVTAGHQVARKQVRLAEYILPTFLVDIKLPKYATYNRSEIVANVKAAYTYGKPVQGDVTLTVQPLVRYVNISARPLNQYQYKAKLEDGYASIPVNIVKDLKLELDDFEREIEFFALVQEELTGHKYNKTKVMKIHNRDIKVQLIKTADTFKPGLNYLVLLKVAYQDDTPVEDSGSPLKLRYHFRNSDAEETTVSMRPKRGLVEHIISIPGKVKLKDSPANYTPFSLNMVAEYRNQLFSLNEIIKSESPSDNYIQISHRQENGLSRRLATTSGSINDLAPTFQIGEEIELILRATEPMYHVVVLVVSRGMIIHHTSLDGRGRKEISFSLPVTAQMAPMARVVSYYMRGANNEIVADAINLSIDGLFRTDVRILTSDKELEPRKDLEIHVRTKPKSFVGLLGIDQSVLLLRSGNDITKNDVTKEVKSYESNPRDRVKSSSVLDASNVDSFSAKSIFEDSNLLVITNGLLYDGPATREGKLLSWQGSIGTSDKGSRNGIIALDQLILEDRLAAPEFHIERQANDRVTIRDNFPETWLWANATSGQDGVAQFKSKTPDSITSWVISAFSLNDQDGLGIANTARVTVFKQFFVRLNLPYSIIRGETVKIQAIIHNYSKRPTRAIVTMDNRKGDFEFVEAANKPEEEKHNQQQQKSTKIEIGAEEGKAVSFLVTPKRLGHLDVVVTANGERFSDGIRQTLLVKSEGQTQFFNKAIYVGEPGGTSSTNFKRNITIDIPANAVPGSVKVFLSAVGDMMSFSLNHLNEILRLPIDGGEQNIMNLMPNIIIYNYMNQSNQLNEFNRGKLLSNIANGYQQELTYRRDDGSFSPFGNKDKSGSTWLTAYVLQTLNQAKEIITVDQDVVQRAFSYLANRQLDDGSFEELGELHNRNLGSEKKSSIYLTAFALLAMIQNKDIEQKPEISIVSTADIINKGLRYLEQHIGDSVEPYDLAIVSYVLQMARSSRSKRDAIYSKLTQVAQNNEDYTWWQSDNSTDQVDTDSKASKLTEESLEREFEFHRPNGSQSHRPTLLPRVPPLKPLAVTKKHSEHLFVPDSMAIEMTSYALMTIVSRGDLEYGLPVVRWLVAQQNSNGGFASSHDTVLALQALSQYQARVRNISSSEGQPTTLDIDFSYPNLDKDGKRNQLRPVVFDQMLVKRSNSLLYQTKELPENTTWIEIQASGHGSAVLQVSWQYNLVVSAEEPSFFLNPQLDRSSNEYYLQLSICTYYKAGEVSNTAVMEVDLPSGYVAEAEALPSITRTKHVKQIQLSQQDTHLSVFFDKMTREEICFTIPAHRSTFIANNKRAAVTIYDYYNRQKAARIFYEPHLLTTCQICDQKDCGEQCSS